MRKIRAIFVFTLLLGSLISSNVWAASPNAPKIIFNDKVLATDVAPVEKSGRMLVPVRLITEALGAEVSWEAQKVLISKNGETIELTLNKKEVFKNGNLLTTLDVPAQLIKDRTMVPVRFISETFGATVNWSEKTRSIIIDFLEKRDGLTANDILTSTVTNMKNQGSYKFKNLGKINISTYTESQKLSSTYTVEGSYRKTGAQEEINMTETFIIPAKSGTPEITVKIEMYSKDKQVYQRTDAKGWQQLTEESKFYEEIENNDPLKGLAKLSDYSDFLIFKEDKQIAGKDYYVIKVHFDENKVKDLISKELDVDAAEISKLLKTSYSQLLYIEKGTLLLFKAIGDQTITVSDDEEKVTTRVEVECTTSDYGSSTEMPNVPVEGKNGAI